MTHPALDQWGTIGELFSSASARGGQGNPSRIEREYTNVMRIVGLSMPPDIAEEMRDAQFGFERAMATISKNTAGIRRDLPVELDPLALPAALKAWDDGRVALNAFFTCLNTAVGLSEMQTIPPTGPRQFASYGRSQRRYLDYKKKVKLCQNRGGPQLSQAWGGLMISGYMQDSCGIRKSLTVRSLLSLPSMSHITYLLLHSRLGGLLLSIVRGE